MSKKLFFLIFFFFSQLSGTPIQVQLQREIKVNTHSLKVKELFPEINDEYFTLKIEKSKILSLDEIGKIFKSRGFQSVIFIGETIRIDFIQSLPPKEALNLVLPSNFSVQDLKLSDPIYIEKKQLIRSNQQVYLKIQGFRFPSAIGKPFQQVLRLQPKNSTPTPLFQLIRKPQETLLIYKKNNLTISTPVKILRTLDSNRFLVENKKSGKRTFITASLKEEF